MNKYLDEFQNLDPESILNTPTEAAWNYSAELNLETYHVKENTKEILKK